MKLWNCGQKVRASRHASSIKRAIVLSSMVASAFCFPVLAQLDPVPDGNELTDNKLLSEVSARDEKAIKDLRRKIFKHACDERVFETLLNLAAEPELKSSEIDLVVHASIFCTNQGKKLLEVLMDNSSITNIRRSAIRSVVSYGLGGYRMVEEYDELQMNWMRTQSFLVRNETNSKKSVDVLIEQYRENSNSIKWERIMEKLSSMVGPQHTNELFPVIAELIRLEPDDPYMNIAHGTVLTVEGAPNAGLPYLRKAWRGSRHIDALYLYSAALVAVYRKGNENLADELREATEDLLRFQRFHGDFSAMLILIGGSLDTSDPENAKLMKRVVPDIDIDRPDAPSNWREMSIELHRRWGIKQ